MTCTNDCLTDAKVQQANTKNSTENLSLIKKNNNTGMCPSMFNHCSAVEDKDNTAACGIHIESCPDPTRLQR